MCMWNISRVFLCGAFFTLPTCWLSSAELFYKFKPVPIHGCYFMTFIMHQHIIVKFSWVGSLVKKRFITILFGYLGGIYLFPQPCLVHRLHRRLEYRNGSLLDGDVIEHFPEIVLILLSAAIINWTGSLSSAVGVPNGHHRTPVFFCSRAAHTSRTS